MADLADAGSIARSDVLELFAKHDPTVVSTAFTAAAKALRVDGPELSLDDALRVLERMASERGPIGVTARFAKARLVLRVAATADTTRSPSTLKDART